jgi:uncharacterized hydrophobic protein (TIGR00271 family)
MTVTRGGRRLLGRASEGMAQRAVPAGGPHNAVSHMRDAVFFDGETRAAKLSRFWLLLILAAVIATTGVVGDSDATVIGAMIVAPLMTPILGIMLAVVLTDWPNLVRSVALVLAGAATAVAIGCLVGLLVPSPVDAANNAQVASRVTPNLISLLAALATGAVGSVALVRSDISDTLPGVAIAISLVPPLTVVGLTLDARQPGQAAGALLLFLTNVTAILAAGLAVMGLYRVHRLASAGPTAGHQVNRRRAVLLVAAMIVVVAVPLAQTSIAASLDNARETSVQTAAGAWAGQVGWQVAQVTTRQGRVQALLTGPLPVPDSSQQRESLRAQLAAHGVDPRIVDVHLVPDTTIQY